MVALLLLRLVIDAVIQIAPILLVRPLEAPALALVDRQDVVAWVTLHRMRHHHLHLLWGFSSSSDANRALMGAKVVQEVNIAHVRGIFVGRCTGGACMQLFYLDSAATGCDCVGAAKELRLWSIGAGLADTLV